jgi:hypothetical protein
MITPEQAWAQWKDSAANGTGASKGDTYGTLEWAQALTDGMGKNDNNDVNAFFYGMNHLFARDPVGFQQWEMANPEMAVRWHALAATGKYTATDWGGWGKDWTKDDFDTRAANIAGVLSQAAGFGEDGKKDGKAFAYNYRDFDDINHEGGSADFWKIGQPNKISGGLGKFVEDNPWQVAAMVAAAVIAPQVLTFLTAPVAGTAAGIAATAAGGATGLGWSAAAAGALVGAGTGAITTAAGGGSLGDVLTGAAIGGATGGLAGWAPDAIGTLTAPVAEGGYGLSQAAAEAVYAAGSGSVTALASGADINQIAQNALLTAGVGMADLDPAIANAAVSGGSSYLTGGDATNALINAGLAYAGTPSPATPAGGTSVAGTSGGGFWSGVQDAYNNIPDGTLPALFGSLATIGGQAYASNQSANASQNIANTQANASTGAANAQIAAQQAALEEARRLNAPFLAGGYAALPGYLDTVLDPARDTWQTLQNDPYGANYLSNNPLVSGVHSKYAGCDEGIRRCVWQDELWRHGRADI